MCGRGRKASGALAVLLAVCLYGQTPAGLRPAKRSGEEGSSILPGGRQLTPHGKQYFTGPGPFGLAISPDGHTVVTADGGPNRYGLTLFNEQAEKPLTSMVAPHPRRDEKDPDDDGWRSIFMGLAFESDAALYASEGESGRIRRVDLRTGKGAPFLDLNQGGARDSYSGDLAYDPARHLLYAVDQANFRLAIIDTRRKQLVSSLRTGRLPFAVALSPDRKTVYVTNLGMFEYRALPGADPKNPETGVAFPLFGFPSAESLKQLGDPNAAGSNSLAIVDVSKPAAPRLVAQVPTGLPFGGIVMGGSSPSGVAASARYIYVANANQDSITVIDAPTHARVSDIGLRMPGYGTLRGVLPIGVTLTPDGRLLLVAEAGINAVAVIDAESRVVLGHVPSGWFPTRVRTSRNQVFVANAKGHGTGPNSTAAERAANARRGTVSRYPIPSLEELNTLTAAVMANNGFSAVTQIPAPPPVQHVVIIVKENRTYDEVFGDLPDAANGPRAGEASLARWGLKVTPNHHAIARRWSTSDNFYADSEVSVDGHHWLVGSYPNAWTESTLMASYGGQKSFRLPTTAPGRLLFAGSDSSLHPEEQLEAGALWHHLERNHVSFFNFGEGFELAGIDEGEGLEPTGGRFFTNMPMPDPLFRNTSRRYPGFNTNISDQYRATQFIAEMGERYGAGKSPLPQLLFIHLPNDHTARPRPRAGYPTEASYVSDNDLALGRILEYLSHSEWWSSMAVLITEDDSQSGVDHVDSHRTVLMAAGPYARRNYTSHVNTSFPGLLKTAFWLLRMPPLNLYDAAAVSLSDCFTTDPDPTPYDALPVDPTIFDPTKVRTVKGENPGPAMDDPAEIRRQRRGR
ncbi:MAG TPA: bifunctional YncE family protein/alkaline phosphatase family protein [Candidatus Sulfopaludibacter sp.]|jgi:DNA-binding beta-propeller fold protein YncE|nr:bifunctional YncE family protein/alkaline phosphatase family protein [Candidatus Sulfopaludibacter sp.]